MLRARARRFSSAAGALLGVAVLAIALLIAADAYWHALIGALSAFAVALLEWKRSRAGSLPTALDAGMWHLSVVIGFFVLMAGLSVVGVSGHCDAQRAIVSYGTFEALRGPLTPSQVQQILRDRQLEPSLKAHVFCADVSGEGGLPIPCPHGFEVSVDVPIGSAVCTAFGDDRIPFRAQFDSHGYVDQWTL